MHTLATDVPANTCKVTDLSSHFKALLVLFKIIYGVKKKSIEKKRKRSVTFLQCLNAIFLPLSKIELTIFFNAKEM